MALKKSIPRVATAALTLGGAATGCGGSSDRDPIDPPPPVQTDVEVFCDGRAYCEAFGDAYYYDCLDRYYDNVLSYYDASCQNTIRDMLGCLGDYATCTELNVDDFSICGAEVDAAYYQCGFDFYAYVDPVPQPVTDVEVFCDAIAYCYGYDATYFEYCADRYYDNVLSYYDAYCSGIIQDMLGCLGDYATCNDLYNVDFSDCYYEVDDAYYYCGFDFYYYF